MCGLALSWGKTTPILLISPGRFFLTSCPALRSVTSRISNVPAGRKAIRHPRRLLRPLSSSELGTLWEATMNFHTSDIIICYQKVTIYKAFRRTRACFDLRFDSSPIVRGSEDSQGNNSRYSFGTKNIKLTLKRVAANVGAGVIRNEVER
ncbi:hypothetical protein EVAR_77211_1 [Eumeta japonica]|uniref:Uncharacterized protein n=1 Tax=Eumeta variegata TaxID=151549 RepID=A0A4C1T4P5_EUMVA|nr:hypothetical protein EVAR_77211_1 [Eumeta japonica]